ncbi:MULTISPECIES: chemotaxis protein CheB [unclassified Pseudomonas]|uniref:chemotaxis protein CheB n=1 Tax=unclassified Pseudomonas TaxID=196821 RepID=UPI0025E0EEF7|nr:MULTISPECIES: chemotaxis protein CheB [unclassified Pseudomonas]
MDMETKTQPRDVIVIGGSQGAFDVLRQMLVELPSDFPAAVLIVIHSVPSTPGHLASILDRYSVLPVGYGQDGEAVRPGRVYLAPPDRHLEIAPTGLIHLSDGPKVRYARPAADRLFETAAQVFGSRVISVILSGGDCDGTYGANVVSVAGGLSLVQEPRDALVPSMPLHAIQNDHPAAVVNSTAIAKVLMQAVAGLPV